MNAAIDATMDMRLRAGLSQSSIVFLSVIWKILQVNMESYLHAPPLSPSGFGHLLPSTRLHHN